MVTFDFGCFAKLFSKLRLLINASITFYDEDFKGTCACTSPGSPFCWLVKEHNSDKCTESDTQAFVSCINSDKNALCYKCHFGMTEMAFRLTHNNKTYGYVIVGPFRNKGEDEKVYRKIKDYCDKTGVSYEEMTDKYNDISFYSEEKFEAIETLIYALFDYALSQKIILLNQNDFIDIFDEFLQEHLSEDISIRSLSSHFYLSQKQLYTLIKKAKGVSPKAYIIQKRIKHAQQLIKSTDLSLQQVAESVGMPDYPYFFKVFKSITGHSPNYYRKND